MRDPAVGGGQSYQVHPVQFVTQVPPRVVGGVLDHPYEQEGEPAELDVAADAVFVGGDGTPAARGRPFVSPAVETRKFAITEGAMGRTSVSRLRIGRQSRTDATRDYHRSSAMSAI